jgi:hypothetical protein
VSVNSSPRLLVYSNFLEEYGNPASEYLAIDEGCTSIEDHLDCQSNHKYLAASLFRDNKKGMSVKLVFKEKKTPNISE